VRVGPTEPNSFQWRPWPGSTGGMPCRERMGKKDGRGWPLGSYGGEGGVIY
jgi:hypothetical protein